MTYEELNREANQLAHYIGRSYQERQCEELKPDTLIALCLERSLDMIIAILAVLKAGAAYVPIDPNSPLERTHHILNDTQTVLLLTCNTRASALLELKLERLQLLVLDKKPYHQEPTNNLETSTKSTNLAYVIYTSGTTGIPKGVMLMHANVMRLFTATQSYFAFSSEDVWTLYHSYTFDFSVWELWGALLHGGLPLIPSKDDVVDMGRFYKLCADYKVSILNQTPSAFQAFAQYALQKKPKALALRFIIFGGEMLHVSKLASWWKEMGEACPKLINMYGITETTVHVTLKALSSKDQGSVIGRALADLKTYVLDEQKKLVPVGVIGELFISGAGVAKGYLNQPELTKERFIINCFANEADKNKGYSRLYKTGDLVRRLEEGELEYISRNDSQVKIRGYRIELQEVEQAFLCHPLIQQCAVIVRHSPSMESMPYLIAYFIARRKLIDSTVQLFLATRLPSYMLPSKVLQVTSFPLTSNGKLDYKAFPEPQCNFLPRF